MITVHYKDEIGDIEASFETIDEYNKFKAELIDKFEAKQKEAQEKAEKKVKEFVEQLEARWNELKADAKSLVEKAKGFGVTPKVFLEMIRSAMFDASDDRCNPAQEEQADPNAEEPNPNEA